MHLTAADFDGFLAGDGQALGQDFLWRPSSACPCFNPTSGAARPRCLLCGGKGRIWSAPVHSKAGMTQQNNIKHYAPLGRYESGDATLTVPQSSPMYSAGQFDRLTCLNATEPFSLTRTRGDGGDRLYAKVLSVSKVFWLNPTGTAIVLGGQPLVSDEGLLSWPEEDGPPLGAQYTVDGVRHVEYFVWDSMPSNRGIHFGERLPKKLLVRNFDLFSR